MSRKEAFIRYHLIIRKIRRNPSTLKEIEDFLARESELQEYDLQISKRTFKRDLEEILLIYNIDIQYDFSKKVYYINNDDQPELSDRLLESFDIVNALNLSDRVSKYIHFENRPPQGTENLYGLLHAIKNQLQIRFDYHIYWNNELTQRIVEPYALKEFRNRWYVLAVDMKDGQVKSFALDRLTELEITKTKFKKPIPFDVNEHYKNSFGIISPNSDTPEEIQLWFDQHQGKYIKSLPLHESQQVVSDDSNGLVIKLNLFLTHDFIMEILSHGNHVKVLKPEHLVETIMETLSNSIAQYS